MGFHKLKTKINNYPLSVAASALQKEIRRGNAVYAGYWANELYLSNYHAYLWRRLLVISAEDCAGIITGEVLALYKASMEVIKHSKDYSKGRIFMGKALSLLICAQKCRDADHINNFTHAQSELISKEELDKTAKEIEATISLVEKGEEPFSKIPLYIYDCHTNQGRRKGMTRQQFFIDEYLDLKDRAIGLLDAFVGKCTVTKAYYPEGSDKDDSPEDDLLSGLEDTIVNPND